ncbi:hypothetical protein Tcan_03845 [Toxocara canis]|uniref:Uncharacterized protein n=1 Tax=Toxocara canis TaxID=6265 RepID=A0A0B2VD21_TOXCA|nr:hypothetical protein Tcan_03845 [Toxocara canis]
MAAQHYNARTENMKRRWSSLEVRSKTAIDSIGNLAHPMRLKFGALFIARSSFFSTIQRKMLWCDSHHYLYYGFQSNDNGRALETALSSQPLICGYIQCVFAAYAVLKQSESTSDEYSKMNNYDDYTSSLQFSDNDK